MNSGKIALSADGDTILWQSGNAGALVSHAGGALTAVSSLPSGAVIASDKKNNTVFYGASGSQFFVSADGGNSFTKTAGGLGSSTSPVKVVVNPGATGDVWVSTDRGLFHSTNSGASFSAIPNISQVRGITSILRANRQV